MTKRQRERERERSIEGEGEKEKKRETGRGTKRRSCAEATSGLAYRLFKQE